MKKSHVINIVKKIIAIFIIVLILNNNYINYNVWAVGNSEIVADKMEQYVEEKILNKLTDEQKESRSWNWQDYEITNYMVDKLGILFLEYETEEEMLDKSNRITDLVKVIYT